LNLRKIKHNVLNAKLHQREADIVASAGQAGIVTIATNMAGRGTDIKLSAEVIKAGGLAIVGTERHESRRVDRQLRGRAGRQGDPGSSIFYVSLEDDLMRLFATERIAGLMDKMGFKEGDVLEHNMLSKSVERAQKKVEENNFGIRKRLLEYDDVMNSQREVVYKRRRNALMGERIGIDVVNMIYDTAVGITEQFQHSFEDLKLELLRVMAIDLPYSEEEFKEIKSDEQGQKVFEAAMKAFKRKSDKLAEVAQPVIKQVYENQGAMYENILIPVTDGKKVYNISCNLKEAYESDSKALVKAFEKSILLHTIDENWKEHLREMDDLRQSVQNASYEQKDPLLIYKLESFNLFKVMVEDVNSKSVSVLMRGQIPIREPEQVQRAAPEQKTDFSKYRTEKEESSGKTNGAPGSNDTRERKMEPIRVEKKVGRNDPCPCGSGKKFKNCHGR
ncbi:MAG: SEC-C metal-binding domain-containing protein, partial [Dysgonamonadaceae bacterium]|nr:SEC-C metal-binding domain-containing protein [Dysgonamonadaceae bacterium]